MHGPIVSTDTLAPTTYHISSFRVDRIAVSRAGRSTSRHARYVLRYVPVTLCTRTLCNLSARFRLASIHTAACAALCHWRDSVGRGTGRNCTSGADITRRQFVRFVYYPRAAEGNRVFCFILRPLRFMSLRRPRVIIGSVFVSLIEMGTSRFSLSWGTKVKLLNLVKCLIVFKSFSRS